MEPGEKRLAYRLEAKLEEDYLLWFDVPVGTSGYHPDFILFHPARGLLILEVKDWKRETIQRLDKNRATILTQAGAKETKNPFEQARTYAQTAANLMEKDPSLTQKGGQFHGGLIFPWSYGVVFPRISRKAFNESDMGAVLPPERVICQDEMVESVEAEAFQRRLWEMLPWKPQRPLSLPQIDRIRWHLFPEVRVGGEQLDLFSEPSPEETLPDLIRVMDLQQEQLARSLGDGHRVIHGVAGSGKTMILGYRCLHLAKATNKPILVLCFNRTLAESLNRMLAEHGLSSQVLVRNFHKWCHEQLRQYHVEPPPQGLSPPEFFEQQVQCVIQAADRGQIPQGQYGAVLVDEGHDFEPEWLKLIAQMVSPETNSLLLLYDDAQNIYRNGKFSFKSVGIQAQGRTTILRLNYRNTAEILRFAYNFARDVLTPEEAEEDGVPLLAPESAGRHGPEPELVRLPSLNEQVDYMAGRLKQLNDEGTPWRDMALLYRNWGDVGKVAVTRLRTAGIPFQWVGKNSPLDTSEDSVKIITYHSSKGLEFPVVSIPRAYSSKEEQPDEKEEMRLLYVAMTRATDRLVVGEAS
jgi:hypothetical protein